MLLDVSIPAEQLDAIIDSESQYAPDGKILHIFSVRSDDPSFYHVFAYTFVNQNVEVANDENYNEDIQLLSLHYQTMFYK